MMTKIVDFLEQQVQWVAIGIGGLFLAFTIWAYVINNPIATPLNGATVTLGNVNQTVLDTAGKPLQEKINSTVEIPSMGTPPEFSGPFTQQMAMGRTKYQAVTMGGHWLDAPTASGTPLAAPGERGNGPVVSLPTPPAPQLVGVLAHRAQVTPPVIAGANNANPVNAAPEDKNWVTVEGKISIAGLGPELTKAKFPPANQTTEFLRIQVERQEQMPDGTWGNDTTLDPPLYLGIPPWPASANPAAGIQYQLWAKANVMTILQPPPYQVVQGTPWYLPSDVETAQALIAPAGPAFDATNMGMKPITPEQKKAREDYIKSDQYKMRGQHGAPQGPPPGGPGGGGAFAPQDITDAAVLAQATMAPNFNGNGAPGAPVPGAPPDNSPQPQVPQANASAAVQKYNAGLPQGEFDPSKQPDVECWAFDDGVEPGKVYRYRFRYMVANPAYSSPIAGTPQVAHELALISPYSEWSSPPTNVPALVDFFVSTGIAAGNKVNFKIYKWQNGQTTTVNEQDGAGDVIGAQHANANNVDYTTQWTMLAVHRDYDGVNYVMLVNPAGQIIRHNYHDDELDPLNSELRHQVVPPNQVAPNGANPPRPAYQPQRGISPGGF